MEPRRIEGPVLIRLDPASCHSDIANLTTRLSCSVKRRDVLLLSSDRLYGHVHIGLDDSSLCLARRLTIHVSSKINSV